MKTRCLTALNFSTALYCIWAASDHYGLTLPFPHLLASVPMGPSGTNEDDLTVKIGDIIQINHRIKNVVDKHAGQVRLDCGVEK